MATKLTARGTDRKNSIYTKVLDAPLAPVQRKIASALTLADTAKEAARIAGANRQYLHEAAKIDGVMRPIESAVIAKAKKLDKVLALCEDIMARDAETALKYSDKLAAARLYAEATGILEQSKGDTTNNTLVLDLRHATESELLQELAELEEKKRSIIDVTPDTVA